MRDVIQVERAGGAGDGVGQPRGARPRGGGAAATARGPPGRQRPRRDRGPPRDVAGAHPARSATGAAADSHAPGAPLSPAASQASTPAAGSPGAAHAAPPVATDHQAATSTAVGYFALKAGLAVGHRVARGDVLGWVDVLGVRKEIVSPADGVISRFVTEPGDPVEYGQELVALLATTAPAAADDGAPGTPGNGDPTVPA